VSIEKPSFPIIISWHEDGDVESFKNEIDAACTLEWFDSTDKDFDVTVVDSNGKPVILVVEELEIKKCHLQ
jgi:hypothetical protein